MYHQKWTCFSKILQQENVLTIVNVLTHWTFLKVHLCYFWKCPTTQVKLNLHLYSRVWHFLQLKEAHGNLGKCKSILIKRKKKKTSNCKSQLLCKTVMEHFAVKKYCHMNCIPAVHGESLEHPLVFWLWSWCPIGVAFRHSHLSVTQIVYTGVYTLFKEKVK